MKILAIRGKNIASLAERFEIDFSASPLGGCGVFALSGPTGAGKSSILDAMCLALYGCTPRLDRAQKVQVPDPSGQSVPSNTAAQLLRRGSGSGFAEVDFVGIDGRIYRARYSLRRANDRATGRPQQPTHELFLRDEDKPLGGNNSETQAAIAERLGLDFRQFTRAVLLAQNDFAAFLSSSAEERAALLERLTGTERFGNLSARIFERAKLERTKLEALDERLASTPVLEGEARSSLDARISELGVSLAALERKEAAMNGFLAHRQRLEELQRAALVASADLREREREMLELAPEQREAERIRLILMEGRELVVAARRAEGERARLEAELLERKRAIEAATVTVQRELADEAASRRHLEETRARELEARPLLRRVVVLEQELAQANAEVARTRELLGDLQRKLAQLGEEGTLARARVAAIEGETTEISQWFAARPELAAAVEGWQGKRDALERAIGRRPELDETAKGLETARRELESVKRELSAGEAGLESLSRTLNEHAARADASKALASGDDWELLEGGERSAADRLTRHDELTRLVRELAARRHELLRLERENAANGEQITSLSRDAEARDVQIGKLRRQVHDRTLELRGAERMVGESVEALRAALKSGEPCPVCGSTEHPFGGEISREVSARLRSTLEGLRLAVEESQSALADTEREQQLTRGELARLQGQLAAMDRVRERECSELDAVAGRLGDFTEDCVSLGWSRRELQPGAELWRLVEAPATLEALGRRRANLAEALSAAEAARLAAKQRAASAAEAARALAVASATLAHAESDVRRRQHVATELERGIAALSERHKLLALEQARDLAPFVERPLMPNWLADWDDDPKGSLRTLDALVQSWQQRLERKRTLDHERTAQLARIPEIGARKLELARHIEQTEGVLASNGIMLEKLQSERRELFQGRPIEAVEAEIYAKVKMATEGHELAQVRRVAAERELGVLVARLEDVTTAREAAHRLAAGSEATLEAWLAGLRQSRPELAVPRAELWELVETGPTTLRLIETRLSAARGALDQAHGRHDQAILAYQSQMAADAHVEGELATAFADGEWTIPESRASEALLPLAAAIAANRESRREELAKLSSERERDDDMRERVGRTRAERDEQRRIAEKWLLLSELIGSADGKRLRHLAQEVTLDLVLAHANRHLRDLARRYRLERLPEGLHVVVIDAELYDGTRSIASLSGGETFLVSLALALGLASLSAEKVRVETLFIDEGFGSLDQATLQIAVAALDRVQAEGRQVGVVSHVGELAERLGVEVRVEPAGGGKSRVRVLARDSY